LAAARTSTGGLLTWVNTSSNASGVRIERRLSPSGSFAQIASLAAGVMTYADNAALLNETYEYRILAFNDLGDSSFSTTAILGPLAAPSSPTNFSAAGASLGSVALTWQSGSLSTAGYTIERRAEGTADFVLIGSTTSLTFTDSTAAPDTGYEYRIRATNSVGNSTFTTSNAIATPNIQPTPVTTATGQGADAHISEAAPSTNFGSSPTWVVEDTSVFTDAFLRFDLASVSTGSQWLLVDVELEATLTNAIPTAGLESGAEIGFSAYLVYPTAPAWSESSITWNNAPWRSSPSSSFTGGSDGRILGEMVMATSGSDVPAGTVATLQIWSASWKTTLLNTITTALAGSDKKVEFYFNRPNNFQAAMASAENPTYAPPKLTLKFQKLTPNRATNLAGSVTGLGSISLTWADTATDETGYRIEASTNGGASYSTVATLGANATSISTSSIPPVAGNHLYRVVAFNARGDATPSLTVTLAPGVAPIPPPAITTTSLPAGNQGNAYSRTLTATGGSGALTWTISSGSLPAGLTLSSAGVISGTPGGTGTSSFTVRVTDTANSTDSRAFTLTINAPVVTNAVYEPFNYTPGSDLNTQTQPAQFGGWKAGAAPGITASAGSLAYTNGGTLATAANKISGGNWQSTGMGINFPNGAWDPYKVSVANQWGGTTPAIAQGTMYVSFLMQSTAGNEAALGLYTGDTNASPFSQLAVGTAVRVTAGGAVTLRVASYNPANTNFDQVVQDGTTGASHTVQNASLSVAANSVNFFVLKIEFGATTDTVSLFVNPAVGVGEGTPSATITTPAGEALIFRSLAVFLGYNANANFADEIRLAGTWADAVPPVAPVLTGFAAWADTYGLPTDGTGDGSPTAILAGDGITNLMKYALGIDPEVSGYQGHYSTDMVTVGGADYLSFTYIRPEPAPEGVTYIPQACSDLSSWSGSGLAEVSSTVSGGLRTITVRDGAAVGDNPRRFLRLKITTP
jgi:hypothetical protein